MNIVNTLREKSETAPESS